MGDNLPPRPAATVLTLRDAPEGYEILMMRRNVASDFVGGAYVFPGGAVDPDDARASSLVLGLSDEEASSRLGLASGGLAYYVAGLRELFEEAGLLRACDPAGNPVNLEGPSGSRAAAIRERLNQRDGDFLGMLGEEGFRLDLRDVEYLAHWITPVGSPRRYDTRFFVTTAPDRQVAVHDDGETVAERWLRPRDALGAHGRGEMAMLLPTIRNLQAIAGFDSAGEVLAYTRSLTSIAAVEPQLVERDGVVIAVTPGDEGFPVPEAWRRR